MTSLQNIEPKKVFHWFYELNQIPRCSGDEKRVSDFLVNFAKERGLEVYQDEAYNVIIKKEGTPGYEKSDPVIIQGHMDMVCIKGEGSNHDFSKDPIEMIVEGDILRANNTTLGGDNGIAIAYGLAILDSDDLKHPPLEILITTSEETGMDGAQALTNEHLSGKILLNLDSEEEGVFLVSCAGGCNKIITFDLEKEMLSGKGLKINISGLKGGHSGMEINKQRANAIKLLGRILNLCNEKANIRLSQIQGGTKHNAIPSEAMATVLADDMDKVKNLIDNLVEDLKEEYRVEDSGLKVDLKEVRIENVYTKELSDNLIDFIMMIPDGVQYMSKDIEGLVQTSLNNAIIEEKDNTVEITTSVRSSSGSSLREILDILSVIAKRTGARAVEEGAYPAWQYDENSKIRDKAVKVYEELFNKKAKVTAIHAGLECGLLKEILPDTDMISFGPNLYDVHTEKEHLSISSVERVWKFLIKLLEELK
ncbi:aminoacyl-histidine dipeptidase [Tepidimicrobium xylanilyticum]|uniref:Cytosol non-specific dipeptidase n=1 Tax=Tepidimicrobium xylanilyticum TaxID=1123352 RepID=A0A1H3BXI2_9FIRM|nr:aminoacyl-histidine dipeptidase [Tepidimicrobium xylanilyticum]GMG97281.1 aminoacyl-histidine dipeptidase [Tepidimicrobium xylanilyticum]SDX46491.1 dipeptidase D [Tepidimicrobium xylanilyticum]